MLTSQPAVAGRRLVAADRQLDDGVGNWKVDGSMQSGNNLAAA